MIDNGLIRKIDINERKLPANFDTIDYVVNLKVLFSKHIQVGVLFFSYNSSFIEFQYGDFQINF